MHWLSTILQTLQVISSILVIVLVLLQQGKGADMGAAFGGGSAGSVFGAAGAANFLSRATKWAAIVFFVTTGGLAWVAHHPSGSPIDSGIMQGFVSSESSKSNDAAPSGSEVPNVGTEVPGLAADSDSKDDAIDAVPSVPADNGGAAVPTVPAE